MQLLLSFSFRCFISFCYQFQLLVIFNIFSDFKKFQNNLPQGVYILKNNLPQGVYILNFLQICSKSAPVWFNFCFCSFAIRALERRLVGSFEGPHLVSYHIWATFCHPFGSDSLIFVIFSNSAPNRLLFVILLFLGASNCGNTQLGHIYKFWV